MPKTNNWKKVIFAIAIALLFIPMVFLGVNTFFPDDPENDCYEEFKPYKIDDSDERTEAEIEEQRVKQQECQDAWQEQKDKHDAGKFITLMIICIIASLVTLRNLDVSIIYGLFAGVVITAFVGTMMYMRAKSMLGFFLLVGLFVIIIFFVQKRRK